MFAILCFDLLVDYVLGFWYFGLLVVIALYCIGVLVFVVGLVVVWCLVIVLTAILVC